MRIFLIVLGFCSLLFSGEPSAFNAGNLNSDTPYGLSPQEQEIYRNKQDIKSLKVQVNTLQNKLDEIDTKLEGLTTLFQGYAQSNGGGVPNEEFNEMNSTVSGLKSDVQSTLNKFDRSIRTQNTNISNIKKVLNELSSIIDNINNNYVSKDELSSLKKK